MKASLSTPIAMIAAGIVWFGTGTGTAIAKDHAFTGSAKCGTCHKSASQGEQLAKWQATAHAKAYETLGTDKAKELGKKAGVDDPQKSDACLQCHVTAHGVDAALLGPKYDATEGVGCESCHGAGADYDTNAIMKAIMTGETEPASVGLIIPNEKTCRGCHNEKSPTFAGFDYEKFVAKIAHPIPEERKARYKK
jgi:hypothetical protein